MREKNEKKSAVQSFKDFRNRQGEAFGSCAQHLGKGQKTRDKVLCFAQKILYGSSRVLRTDIVDDRINGESLHQPVELFGSHGTKLIGRTGPREAAAFNPLIKEQETVAFPQQSFYL
jgi:hypothetical protein